MRVLLAAAAVSLFLAGAAHAQTAPCRTAGDPAATVIAVPGATDAESVALTRMTYPALSRAEHDGASKTVTCRRRQIDTAQGVYVLGGENTDDFVRIAVRADGRTGRAVYMISVPGQVARLEKAFVLVAVDPGIRAMTVKIYTAIPTDDVLARAVADALTVSSPPVTVDFATRMTTFGFQLSGPPSSYAPPSLTPDGNGVVVGPAVLFSGDVSQRDPRTGLFKPASYACPQTLDGLPVLLATVEMAPTGLICTYKTGTNRGYEPNANMRYRLRLDRPDQGPKAFFDGIVANFRTRPRIRDKPPMLAPGPAPLPEFAAAWELPEGEVRSVFLASIGGWAVSVQANYPISAETDVEAAEVVKRLFRDAFAKVGNAPAPPI